MQNAMAGSGCCALLFTVGAVKCRLAKASWVWGGFENLLYGVIGAVGAWLVGLIFNAISPTAVAV